MSIIMVIAGGMWQVPLIKKIKQMGHSVLNTNLYEDSTGFEYSDFSDVADVLDKEKNLEIAKKYTNIKAVLTDQSDIAVPTVAYVAEEIGCTTIGSELAELFTNKYKMRSFCEENGFKSPEYQLCETVEEAIHFMNKLRATVVIKPLDSQSSRGVYVIESTEELLEKFDDAKKYSKDKTHVLVERFIQGTEFTVDGIVVNGKHYSTAISKKSHFEYNPSIANRLFFSHESAEFDYVKLRNTNDTLIDATGLPFGITHAEYKYENDEFYLIEMAARGGGTKIASDIVPYVSGIDTYQLLIESALGIEKAYDINYEGMEQFKNRCALLEFLDIESAGRKIKEIAGEEEIRKIPEVVDFGLEFSVGDIVHKAEDDRSRVGYFIICAESAKKVDEIAQQIKAILNITFE